jgi:hypothetical protein
MTLTAADARTAPTKGTPVAHYSARAPLAWLPEQERAQFLLGRIPAQQGNTAANMQKGTTARPAAQTRSKLDAGEVSP